MLKVLNTQLPLLETYQISNPLIRWTEITAPTSGYSSFQDSGLFDGEFWYCFFTTENSFKCFDIRELMGEEVYTKVINLQATIVLDLSFEPFLNAIDSIYTDVVIKHAIPASQVIFLSNMYDAGNYNFIIANKFNQQPIKTFWFSALEFHARSYLIHFKDYLPITLEFKTYEKKFLNLNRRWRSHRPVLTTILYYKKLLEKGFVSFGPAGEPNNSWREVLPFMKNLVADNQEILSIIEKSSDIINLEPLYLDTNELHINRAELSWSTNFYYENSYFSVVSETTFYKRNQKQSSRFITEKTFKAIAMSHPFILVTIPNSLDVLKEIGYKSFSPWINESYDCEQDDHKRMLMIVQEIERLCNLSNNELNDFLIATKEICKYNYDVLNSKTKFVYER